MIEKIYWYFTDFCLNAANILGISYVEFNMLLFLFILPGILLILLLLNGIRYVFQPLRKQFFPKK